MADEAKLDQDGWTDKTNYDRVNTLLEKVEVTVEEAKKTISLSTNPTKKSFQEGVEHVSIQVVYLVQDQELQHHPLLLVMYRLQQLWHINRVPS